MLDERGDENMIKDEAVMEKSFAVYYARVFVGFGAPKAFTTENYAYLGNHDANGLDGLFALLNNDSNPLGSDEWQHLIRQGITDHTSMSVGDVAVDRDTGERFLCAAFGWEKLSGLKGPTQAQQEAR
jgi:hypothetical protein